MSGNGIGKSNLQSVQTCIHALQKFYHSLEDEKNCIIQSGKQLAVVLQDDDAAWETLYRLNDIILPNIDRSIEKAEELIKLLSNYADMLINTYSKM